MGNKADVLGIALLCNGTTPCEPTWSSVERAVPPILHAGVSDMDDESTYTRLL